MPSQIFASLCSPVSMSASSNQRQSSQSTASTSSHIRNYLLPERIPRSPDLEGQGLKARSPHLSSGAQFEATLSVPDYSHYPSAYSRSTLNQSYPTNKRSSLAPPRVERRLSSPSNPRNVPSRPIYQNGITIPKPFIRLIFCICLVGLGAMILSRIPAAHVPLLRSANDQKPSRSGEYEPPQIHSANMLGRAHSPKATRTAVAFAAHPIPSSHELLALQSYLLQSRHNSLPSDIDPSLPLDGNAILAISPSKLGRSGSSAEAIWLKELEREREEDVVIWAPASSHAEVKKIYELLEKLHVDVRSPVLIDLTGRADGAMLGGILSRLQVDVSKPMVMLGNKPVYGGLETLKRMYTDESLDAELQRIGWFDEWKAEQAREPIFEAVDVPEKAVAGGDDEEGKVKEVAEAVADKPRVMNAAFKHG